MAEAVSFWNSGGTLRIVVATAEELAVAAGQEVFVTFSCLAEGEDAPTAVEATSIQPARFYEFAQGGEVERAVPPRC
jgi:hypothetical protein